MRKSSNEEVKTRTVVKKHETRVLELKKMKLKKKHTGVKSIKNITFHMFFPSLHMFICEIFRLQREDVNLLSLMKIKL